MTTNFRDGREFELKHDVQKTVKVKYGGIAKHNR